jgi:dihydropyrimidinase
VVWDPAKEKTITAASQQSAIDYNVFEGKEVKGLPRFTLTRGQVAMHDGEVRTRRATASSSSAGTQCDGEQGAEHLEGTDRAAPVQSAAAFPASGV